MTCRGEKAPGAQESARALFNYLTNLGSRLMGTRIQALLVHDEEGPWTELRTLLQRQGLETAQAQTYAEAEAALSCIQPPDLVFTDTAFKDGTWADIEGLAKNAARAAPVIVVSRFVDLPLYLDVLERGAADFIVPPFRDADIAYVTRGALLSTSRMPSGLSRATTGTRSTMTQRAQNYSDSGVGAAHAQAGGYSHRAMALRTSVVAGRAP